LGQGNAGSHNAHSRAAAQLAAGDYAKAAESYRQASESNPQDAAAAYQAGTLLAEHGGDLETAERLLVQAAELRPEHSATRYELALVKARRGNVVEGAEMLTTLVRQDPNNSDFVDQFIERLEKDASSGSVGAKYRLGLAYRELGRIEEALVALQAIQHEPEMVVPCLIAIGSCLRRQGLDGAAAKRFAKAIETPGYDEPLYLEALYNLGDLYEAKGTQESLALALSSFEELYARDLTYRDIGERVRVVKTNLSSAERQKVKRLPTRVAEGQGNQ
jgi:tetratricopeptide (TPR) repeat protein